MSVNLSQIEQAIAPLAAPLLQSLWTGTLLPAIQGALKSGSPEIQILETQLTLMLDGVVKAELAKLATI